MGEVLDLDARARGPGLPADPAQGAQPRNDAARRAADDAPRILTVRDLMGGALKRAHDKALPACTTGIREVDRMTGGLIKGFCWVIGAETNWGKSSLIVMVADENLRRDQRVLIVSSEDDEKLYGDRLLCRRASLNADRLRERQLTASELASAARAAGNAEALPVFLDARGRKAEWVAKQVEKIIREHRIELTIFDYLQEFRAGTKYEDRRNEVSAVASMFRSVVKQSATAGIIVSQITVTDGKTRPDKHSIRESKDVPNAAEVVALGYTRNGTETGGGERMLLLDKVKNGRRGVVQLGWDDSTASFTSDLEEPMQTTFAGRVNEANYQDGDA